MTNPVQYFTGENTGRQRSGGIWNDGELAYFVGCGGSTRRINRNQICPNNNCNPNSVSGCWDGVAAGSSCSVHTLGPGWTPTFQGAGTNSVTFSVSTFNRPLFEDGDPRCY